MDRSISPYFAYALILTLVGSAFSSIVPLQHSFASHSDIEVNISGIEFDEGDDVVITGTVDGADENDDVDITVDEAGGGDESDNVDLDSGGDFEFTYTVPDNPDDGIYQVEVLFESDDPVYGFFIVDAANDNIDVSTTDDTFGPGDDVTIEGNVDDEILDSAIEEVEITVIDPNGDEVLTSVNVDVDNNGDFDYNDLQIENEDNAHGRYAIIVEYDDNEEGWYIFEVDEGGSSSNVITATLSESSYNPGDEVVINGEIDEDDVDQGVEVFLTVDDDDGTQIVDDEVEPDPDGSFEFSFDLDDDADLGTYDVTLSYTGLDDKELTFTVTSSSGGGSGGGGSGSSSGLTARLSKTSLLAGETITVTGVVPRVTDDPVNISILKPDGRFVVASFPEPESDESYSATLRLPSTLEEGEDYSVVVFYDGKEVKVSFDITGTASGSDGGPISVETDKTSYSVGSTVQITGEIASDTFVPGQQITLQVFNPDKSPYRFDPIAPKSDGSYSYSMAIGGPLGVTGKWQVKVTYAGKVAETAFDLTGGVPSTPTYQLKYEDMTFPIQYESDGSVKSMFVRPAEKKLVISIDGDEEGTLTIVLPRQVIDAVQGTSDIKYIVSTSDIDTGNENLIDITERDVDGDSRTIVIEYDAGTDLIEIQGTSVVPEFGPLTAIVLAIAIFSIVAVTAKFRRFSTFRQ